ncbi:MAG TPA: M20/M25/M40 family metallo-hydrolase [Solirubrobacteraceae bacterium]|nr:M20/M25/M40 family metallo-hydrolase [Solirubrobacteraceae bacterium]
MRRAALLAALLLAGCGGREEEQRRDPRPAASPAEGRARGGDPERHVEALQRIADRSGGTRAAGTPGDRATVDYVARALRAAGWRVRLRPVRFPYFQERSPPRVAGLQPRREVRTAQYSGSGRVRARVRQVARHGCTPGDYAALRRGEIALADRGTCFFNVKARLAQRAGAAALVVNDVQGETPVSASLLRPGVRIPVVLVTDRAARRLVDRVVSVRVDAVSERRRTTNVVAETAEPRDRWVMAGGHHDSVTAGPGINDNGSGVAALLAVAERLPDRPGLRLGFWGAEELALYGSRAYVRALSREERDAISAYLNFDMLASPNGRLAVYDRDDRLERVLRAAIAGDEREVGLGGASDHAPFERAGIPVGGIFAGAAGRGRRHGPADRCYHRSCDTLDNLDLRLLRRSTDAVEIALRRLAR